MKRTLIAAAFALAAGSSIADDMLFEGRDFTVRLTEAACTNVAIAAVLKQVSTTPARTAVLDHEGEIIASCWVPVPAAGAVAVVGEDGKGALLPMGGFKRKPGI